MEIEKIKLDKGYGDYAELSQPIILRENNSFLITITPTLSNNEENPNETVSFYLEFFRKPIKNNTKALNINSLKSGESFKIKIDRKETYKLLSNLEVFQSIVENEGLPYYHTDYLKISEFDFFNDESPQSIERVIKFVEDHMRDDPEIFDFFDAYSSDFPQIRDVKRIKKISELTKNLDFEIQDMDDIKSIINLLKTDQLNFANVHLNVVRLRKCIEILRDNIDNDDESFFQSFFEINSYILPYIIPTIEHHMNNYRYVGGKKVTNNGGRITDFIYDTGNNNISLVEIKTPNTKLVQSKYRDLYPASTELIGSVLQIKYQKNELMKNILSLRERTELERKFVFDPDTYIIVGKISTLEADKRESFEIFRQSLKDVKILTFDEVISRLQRILDNFVSSESEIIND